MNTTSLFVELIVIGVGGAIWICVLILTFFGYHWIPDFRESLLWPIAVPSFALVYVIGIVSDRMIDILFNRIWGNRMRIKYFGETGDYHDARRVVRSSSQSMTEIIEYSRSRLRICRGWAVHSFLIGISILVFAMIRIPDPTLSYKVSIFGLAAFGFLGGTSWYAWHYLNATQYLKIRELAEFVSEQKTIE